MSTTIKILGPGCVKCQRTFNNAVEAVRQLKIQADVQKVEDIEELLKYNIIATPVLMINDQIQIKGRVAEVYEIVNILQS